MEQTRLLGPKAGSLKYDILTAIGVYGLHSTPTVQTSMMRLTAIITARYNWRLDEITVGHDELARLWAVNSRTVKREMKRLTSAGVLICLRPGVRGRVGAYRLNYRRIYELSREVWAEIGSDFEDRMVELSGERNVVKVDFQPKIVAAQPEIARQGTWGAVRQLLKAQDTAMFESWFAKLVQEKLDDEAIVLRAPNSFVARYIETHLAKQLADAVNQGMPCQKPRKIVIMAET